MSVFYNAVQPTSDDSSPTPFVALVGNYDSQYPLPPSPLPPPPILLPFFTRSLLNTSSVSYSYPSSPLSSSFGVGWNFLCFLYFLFFWWTSINKTLWVCVVNSHGNTCLNIASNLSEEKLLPEQTRKLHFISPISPVPEDVESKFFSFLFVFFLSHVQQNFSRIFTLSHSYFTRSSISCFFISVLQLLFRDTIYNFGQDSTSNHKKQDCCNKKCCWCILLFWFFFFFRWFGLFGSGKWWKLAKSAFWWW